MVDGTTNQERMVGVDLWNVLGDFLNAFMVRKLMVAAFVIGFIVGCLVALALEGDDPTTKP